MGEHRVRAAAGSTTSAWSAPSGRYHTVASRQPHRSVGGEHDVRHVDFHVEGLHEVRVQTFYVEVDMPNIVFAADRPVRLLLDATVWYRPDGALRADVVLPAGSAYTVLSHRSDATTEGLRAEGDLSRLTVPDMYRQLPDSTSDRTRALARQLADDTTGLHQRPGLHLRHDPGHSVVAGGQRRVRPRRARTTRRRRRGRPLPVRVATRFLRADRISHGDPAPLARRGRPHRHRLRAERPRRGRRRVAQPRPRCARLGRGVVPQLRVGVVRSHGVGTAGG